MLHRLMVVSGASGLLKRLVFWRGSGGSTGARGEAVAAAYLARHGYELLDRNVRVPMGEADLVVRSREGVVVLVEVKARVVEAGPGGRRRPRAEEQVGARKRRKLLLILNHLVRANGWERVKKRIDIVAVGVSGRGERGIGGGDARAGGAAPDQRGHPLREVDGRASKEIAG